MNTPGPQGPSRALGDYQVDRAQVYGGQPLQPSATNRPCSLISSAFLAASSDLRTSGARELGSWGAREPPSSLVPQLPSSLLLWLPTSARGPHPFPFRTRSLSPAAPMV